MLWKLALLKRTHPSFFFCIKINSSIQINEINVLNLGIVQIIFLIISTSVYGSEGAI